MAGAAALAGCLAALALAPAAQAAFPGANGKIAYDTGFTTQVSTINPDGTGDTPLTTGTPPDSHPAWSPNGQRIAFSRLDAMGTEIWVMNADGSGQTPLTDDVIDGANDTEPAFSGDGSRIAFRRGGQIYVMNADGSGQTPLTGLNNDSQPAFSPDSQRIAFVREVPGPSNPEVIFVMNADGSGPTNLTPTDNSMDATGPNFSPDGAQLTFSRCLFASVEDESCEAAPEIVRMPSTGGAITEVTSNAGMQNDPFDLVPVFSPDGTRIAFVRDDLFGTSTVDVFTVAASGGAGTQLTTTGGGNFPDWQPVAASTASGGALGAVGGPRGRCFNEDVTIHGTTAKDKLVGTPGNDVIRGYTGKDKINGKGGEDILCGGRGEDRIFGKKGDDILIGGDQSDYLNGGPGINRLFGGTPGAKDEKANNVCIIGGAGTEQNCQVVN